MQNTIVATRSASSPVLMRSAAVARLAGMPVATLRIWEQRYGLASAEHGPSKHRLYSPHDVQRVSLLRQLTQQGHAIGSLAHLEWQQLQDICEASSAANWGDESDTSAISAAPAPMRLAVVGSALSLRLQRPAVAPRLLGLAQVVRTWGTMEQALQERSSQPADILLWHAPELQPGMLEQVAAQVLQAQQTLKIPQVAIIYRYATSKLQQALKDTRILAVREPADDDALVSWLIAMHNAIVKPAPPRSRAPRAAMQAQQAPSPRRYDDATLTTLAGLAPSLACECPNHLAQLLMQLSSFEQYSAGCVNENPEDAQLHTYLHRTTGAARALLEAALERVALHEGLALPASSMDQAAR